MLLNHLSSKQQGVFLGVLNELIMCDGVRTEIEEAKFANFCSLFSGIEPEQVPAAELKNIFTTRQDRVSILLELFSVAIENGILAKPEAAFMEKICSDLELSSNELGQMQMWTKNMLFLIEQSKQLMEG